MKHESNNAICFAYEYYIWYSQYPWTKTKLHRCQNGQPLLAQTRQYPISCRIRGISLREVSTIGQFPRQIVNFSAKNKIRLCWASQWPNFRSFWCVCSTEVITDLHNKLLLSFSGSLRPHRQYRGPIAEQNGHLVPRHLREWIAQFGDVGRCVCSWCWCLLRRSRRRCAILNWSNNHILCCP